MHDGLITKVMGHLMHFPIPCTIVNDYFLQVNTNIEMEQNEVRFRIPITRHNSHYSVPS